MSAQIDRFTYPGGGTKSASRWSKPEHWLRLIALGAAVLCGGMITALGYSAIGRLDGVQQRLTQLEDRLDLLAGADTGKTDNLLSLLDRQARRAQSAASGLRHVDGLFASIDRLGEKLALAEARLDALSDFQQDFLAAAQPQQLAEQSDTLRAAQARLARESVLASSTMQRVSPIIEKLADQSEGISAAENQAKQLIALKDNVLRATQDLPEAVEAIELWADMQEHLVRSTEQLGPVSQALVEISLLQPRIRQLQEALEPLTELVDLRRLSRRQLHAAAKIILQDIESRRNLSNANEIGNAETPTQVASSTDAPDSDSETKRQ